jgi:hypothetical protein
MIPTPRVAESPPVQAHRIFISYSRQDATIVTPLVQLLRLGGTGVFLDVEGISPGMKWRAELVNAVESCELLVLFWCRHAAKSDEVKKEYTRAMAANKRLVPVLLEAIPLTEALAEYQAIDLREALGAHDEQYATLERHVPSILPGNETVVPKRRLKLRVPTETALALGARQVLQSLTRIIGDGL